MSSQYDMISGIGGRLKSYRLGAGLSPEDVAERTGISRAAVYRYESGQPIRVDTLGKIADLLGVSLASLFGVGSENIASAVTFFERLRQIEEDVDQITVLFGPVPYLLTSDAYDSLLPQVLRESVPETASNRDGLESVIAQLMDILIRRKERFRARRPHILGLISALEIEHFLRSGFVGNPTTGTPPSAERKAAARHEVEHLIALLSEHPIGVQIGLVQDSMPGTSFQILRQGNQAQVAQSPFRLGAAANVRIGVATITAARESVRLHQSVTEDLWRQSLKGDAAAHVLQRLVQTAQTAPP